ncbi:uncharacterized protein OCT59_021334 [Rhizophagus irregularis]|uniref:uncharacterized protein n=1 Tax=Rhizophagus irregularis TaxID=588596 RepID=UPI00332D15B6|nr:hypothetical protein OCT59_021334 [Rhizophagus irregularis]
MKNIMILQLKLAMTLTICTRGWNRHQDCYQNYGILTHTKLPNILPIILQIILRYICRGKLSLEEYDY